MDDDDGGIELVDALTEPIALVLALILASAGIRKLQEPSRFALAASHLLPAGKVDSAILVRVAAMIEISLSLGLIVQGESSWALYGVAAVWLAYTCLLALTYLRGDVDYDCGCSFSGARARVDVLSVLQPLLLSLVAVALTQVPVARNSFSLAETIVMACATFALILAITELMSVMRSFPRAHL